MAVLIKSKYHFWVMVKKANCGQFYAANASDLLSWKENISSSIEHGLM
jgi:hypothetical protein